VTNEEMARADLSQAEDLLREVERLPVSGLELGDSLISGSRRIHKAARG